MQKRIEIELESIKGAATSQTENVVITVTERDFDLAKNDWATPLKTRKAFPSRKTIHVVKVEEGDKAKVAITIFGNSFVEISEDSFKMDGTAWGTNPQEIMEQLQTILEG